jgi:hypothetical protein
MIYVRGASIHSTRPYKMLIITLAEPRLEARIIINK